MLVDYTEYRYLLEVNISLSFRNFHRWAVYTVYNYINDIRHLDKSLIIELINNVYQDFLNTGAENKYGIAFRSPLSDQFEIEVNNSFYVKSIYANGGIYAGDISVFVTEFSQIQNYFNN